jgi:hypothetical protein
MPTKKREWKMKLSNESEKTRESLDESRCYDLFS